MFFLSCRMVWYKKYRDESLYSSLYFKTKKGCFKNDEKENPAFAQTDHLS